MLLYLLGEKRKSRLPSVRLSLLLINQTTTFKELLNRLYYSPVQDKRYHDHYVFVFVLYYRDFTAPNYVFTIISLSLQQRTLFIYSTFLPFIFILMSSKTLQQTLFLKSFQKLVNINSHLILHINSLLNLMKV